MPSPYECIGFQCGIPATLEQMLACSLAGFIGPKVCSDPACAPYRSQVWICSQSEQVQQQDLGWRNNFLGGVSGLGFTPSTGEGCNIIGMPCGCSSPSNTPPQGTATGPIVGPVYPTSVSTPCGCQSAGFSLSGSWPWWVLLVIVFFVLWRKE